MLVKCNVLTVFIVAAKSTLVITEESKIFQINCPCRFEKADGDLNSERNF